MGPAIDVTRLVSKDELESLRAELNTLAQTFAAFKSTNSTGANDSVAPLVTALDQKLEALDKLKANLELEYQLASGVRKDFEKRISKLETSTDKAWVELDTSSPSTFQNLPTSTGQFLVSLKTVEPYLDGYKVMLEVGNPYSATFRNLQFNVAWGRKWDEEASKADTAYGPKWAQALKKKVITIPDPLNPGAWNSVSLVIAPATAVELGYFRVGLEVDTVNLKKTSER